ncbi:hypothetical protein NPIL_141191, partial [Nephila pilipes]
SQYCTRNPKCLKCGRPHLTKDCTKDTDPPPPTCAHCQGEHTANHLQRPMNPLNRPKKEDKKKKASEERQKLRAALKEKSEIRTGVNTARPKATPHQQPTQKLQKAPLLRLLKPNHLVASVMLLTN